MLGIYYKKEQKIKQTCKQVVKKIQQQKNSHISKHELEKVFDYDMKINM
jgi:hypothetical protein